MTAAEAAPVRDGDRLARKNAVILSAAQALYISSATIIITLGGLVGQQLAEDKSLATLPITALVLGTACLTVPASLFMRRFGRRAGFLTGAAAGFVSAGLAIYAIFIQSFWLFCLATMCNGAYQAFSMYYRFAAADTASEAFRPKAISWVLVGGVVAAIAGPQIVIWTRTLFDPVMFAGSFAASMVLSVASMVLLGFVDIPKPSEAAQGDPPRPMGEILAQPRLVVAIVCGMVSYGIMNLVMTATPLAMVACDLSVDDAAFVIQWHALAMFAPSFFTGNIIARFGRERVISAGLIMLAACGAVALMGIDIANFWTALVLLGLGWNFAFVGATALVTDCYRVSERNKVQALNDLAVFCTVALASFASGNLLNRIGWDAVVISLFPFVAIALAMIVWLVRHQRRPATA
jgi:predicted MFS family arabinose efflux permease